MSTEGLLSFGEGTSVRTASTMAPSSSGSTSVVRQTPAGITPQCTGIHHQRALLWTPESTATQNFLNPERQVHHAFSKDSSRLVMYHDGVLRVWRVYDFQEICRMVVATQAVVNISFVGDDNSSVIVFFNLFSARVFHIERCPATLKLELKEGGGWNEETFESLSRDQPQSNCVTEFVGMDDTASTFVHCAPRADDGICISITTVDRKNVQFLGFQKYLRSSFVFSSASFGGADLVVVGKRGPEEIPCVCLWSVNDGEIDQGSFAILIGSDGHIVKGQALVLTWDGFSSHILPNDRRVSIVNTRSVSNAKSVDADDLPDKLATVWTYDIPEEMFVLCARLICFQGSEVGEENLLSKAKLILFCNTTWSDTAKIIVVNVASKTIEFQISTTWNYPNASVFSFHLLRQLNEQLPFVISPDQERLLLFHRSLKTTTLYSLKHGYSETTLADGNTCFEPKLACFDPFGHSIIVIAAREGHISQFALPEESIKSCAWSRALSADAIAMTEFCKTFNPLALQELAACGFGTQQEIHKSVASILKPGIHPTIQKKAAILSDSASVQVALSPDRNLAAFVSQSEFLVQVEFWTATDLQEGDANSADLRQNVVLPGMVADESIGPRVAMFYENQDGNVAFALLQPKAEGVFIARVTLNGSEILALDVSLLVEGGTVKIMKTSEDGSKALIIFDSGSFAVVQLGGNFSILIKSQFHPAGGLDNFVDFFIRPSLIHISEDCRTLTVGWDFENNCLLVFSLESAWECTEARAGNSANCLNERDIGLVVWMNRDQSRTIVQRRQAGAFLFEFYDATTTPGQKLYSLRGHVPNTFVGPSGEVLLEWEREFNPSHLDNLRACCLYSLMMLYQTAPDPEIMHLLGYDLNETRVKRLIADYGTEILLAVDSKGKSLIHQSITEQRLDCAKLLFDFAAEQRILVDLTWHDEDVLGWSVQRNQSRFVEFILERIAQRCSTPLQSAKIIRKHFGALTKKFPRVIEKYISEDGLCFEYGRFKVPASVFEGQEECPLAMHCDEDIPWRASSENEAKAFWVKNSPELREKLHETSGIQVTAISKFVCVESPFRAKPFSFVSQLHSAGCPGHVFQSETVRALVQWKWRSACKPIQIVTSVLRLLSALSFFIFVANLDAETGKGGYLGKEAVTAVVLTSCAAACLAVLPFQLLWVLYMALLSSIVAYVHYLDYHNDLSTFLISLECLLALVAGVQDLRPFGNIGPFISMVRHTLSDVVPFATLGSMVIAAFAMAFFVLVPKPVVIESDWENFDSPWHSFEFLFYASLGQFDADVFHEHSSNLLFAWTLLLFITFLFLSAIVLLSVLIAVLSDTFDRVTIVREAELIQCRAGLAGGRIGWVPWMKFVIACRKLLSIVCPRIFRKLQLFGLTKNVYAQELYLMSEEDQIFHFLVPANPSVLESRTKWSGRIATLLKLTKRMFKESEAKSNRAKCILQNALADVKEGIYKQVSRCMDLTSRIEAVDERVASMGIGLREQSEAVQERMNRIEDDHSQQAQAMQEQMTRSVDERQVQAVALHDRMAQIEARMEGHIKDMQNEMIITREMIAEMSEILRRIDQKSTDSGSEYHDAEDP